MKLMTDLDAMKFAEEHRIKAVVNNGFCCLIDPATNENLGFGETWEEAIKESKIKASKRKVEL